MDAFEKLQKEIYSSYIKAKDFSKAAIMINEYIINMDIHDYIECIEEIGIIPEFINHDSTEEKLFAKVSDSLLSRGLIELGLKSRVLVERGDAADVYAESIYHGYSLVGDAKVFRLSRTAKNQKDFKVSGVNSWRHDSEYAILCAPLYQYPKKSSQVYAESIDLNVMLFSWEYLVFLIKNGVKESEYIDLSILWDYSKFYGQEIKHKDIKLRFLDKETEYIINQFNDNKITMNNVFNEEYGLIVDRSHVEKEHWYSVIEQIKKMSKEEAICELIEERKIYKKINQIDKSVKGVKKTFEIK